METNSILLETLTKKESSIIDFWKTKQKEIGISKLEFWVQLNKSIDFYYNEIEKKSKKKNLPTSESLKKLEQPLLKWAEEIKPFIYYYNYNRSNVISINSSIWKRYEYLKNFNILSFNSELKNKPAEQIPEFLDFHLRNFKRQYEKFSNWNELLAEWFRHTKKQIPSTFTPQQKDRFLTWFESHNTVTIGLQNDTVDEPNENDFLISTIDEYLEPFKKNINEGDYNILVSAIKQHIETGSFPELKKEIQITGRPGQKKFGWAINRIYDAKNMGVEKALLIFAHKNISLFKNTKFNEKNYLKSNLYKYYTTKTQ